MKNLSGPFNSSFMRQDKAAAKPTAKSGANGQGQQKAQAQSRHFAIAPPAPRPSGGMPEFKPLFTAKPPLPQKAAPQPILPEDIPPDVKLMAS